MGNVSSVQILASNDPVELVFPLAAAVNVGIAFYDDAEGLTLNAAQATGSATLTLTRQPPGGFVGSRVAATRVPLPECTFGAAVGTPATAADASTVLAVPGAQLQGFGLGAGAGKVILTATTVVHAGAAVTYRLFADAATQ